jgi:hypothetical protein
MRLHVRVFLLFVIVLLLASCATTTPGVFNISTNKDPDYHSVIAQLYFIVDTGEVRWTPKARQRPAALLFDQATPSRQPSM